MNINMKDDYKELILAIILTIIIIVVATMAAVSQSYEVAVDKFKKGEITEQEFINIVRGPQVVSPGSLDALADEYIKKNFSGPTVQAFDPISIITGFVAFLKNEKVRGVLGALFGTKKCDFDKLAEQVGKQYIIEILEEQGIVVPQELKQ